MAIVDGEPCIGTFFFECASEWRMASALQSPLVRYGMGASSAIIIFIVAFTFAEGLMQTILFVIAVTELLIVPQFLKAAAE